MFDPNIAKLKNIQPSATSSLDSHIGDQMAIDSKQPKGSYTLLAHAAQWFNLKGDVKYRPLPDAVKWQLLWAAKTSRACGSVALHPALDMAQLNLTDLALLYKIIRSYSSDARAPAAITQPLLQHIESFFADIVNNNPVAARELIHELKSCHDKRLTILINKLETQANIVQLQPHNWVNVIDSPVLPPIAASQANALDIKALMKIKPETVVLSGTTAKVLLYADTALKVYNKAENEAEEKALANFFQKEMTAYQLIGDSNPNFKFLGCDETKKIVGMTRLKGKSALKALVGENKIDAKTRSAKNSMSQLMKWVANFHKRTLKAIATQDSSYENLQNLSPEIDAISAFEKDIKAIDQDSRLHISHSFDRFLERKMPSALFLAYCNNDVSFSDFFPTENALIDFNASDISPLAKDVAATLVNFYFQTNHEEAFRNYNSGVVKFVLKEAVQAYELEIKKHHPDFKIDVDLVRFFMAHYLLKRSGYESDHMKTILHAKITTLLDSTDKQLDSALECLLSYEKAEYWDYQLGNAMQQAHKITNYSLLAHAQNWFNLKSDPQYPILSDQVRWQLLFASLPKIDEDGTLDLHADFGLEHLSSAEMATLFRIFNSYAKECYIHHPQEKHADMLGKALLSYFEAHIAALNTKRSKAFISELKQFKDANLAQYIFLLEEALKAKNIFLGKHRP